MIRKAFVKTLANECLKPTNFTHKPVLFKEVIDIFRSGNNKIVFDLTFGFGGHSRGLLCCSQSETHLCIDRDKVAYQHALDLNESFPQVLAVNDKFGNLNEICKINNIMKRSVDFILMDLGASSMQMDDGSRGFSLNKNAKLDMRMNQESNEITASDVINTLDVNELSDIFKKYGEERHSKKIAKMIVEYRSTAGHILTTCQLANLVSKCVGWGMNYDSLKRKAHPATQVFQALRIFVNDELNELWSALKIAKQYLKPDSGRCIVISFHSLEDRLVKYAFNKRNHDGIDNKLSRITSGVLAEELDYFEWTQVGNFIEPTCEEIDLNPRARSARMRIGKIVNKSNGNI